MTGFKLKNIKTDLTVGQRLECQRTNLNLSLQTAAEQTKISIDYLVALEKSQYTRLPGDVYARNFLKIYVRSLGGDPDYFLQQFESECGTCDIKKSNNLPRERTRSFQFLVPSRFIKMFAIAVVALAIVTYLGSQIRSIISPPDLFVYEPVDGILTHEALITVTGQAQEEAQVKINGINVLLSQNGTFETDIALERGLNVISVESTKRYSQPAIEYRRVVLQQDHIFSLAP